MTNNEREFQKQIQRLKAIIRKATAGTNIEFDLPPKPKRITKRTIERLKAIKPIDIKAQIAEIEQAQAPKKPIQIEVKQRKKGLGYKPKKGYRTHPTKPKKPKEVKPRKSRKGISPFANLTPEQRSEIAKKAAATRKAKGITPFGNLTPEQRSEMAKKAAETRKAKGITPFGNLTPEQLSARAKKAAATRLAKGIIPFQPRQKPPEKIHTTPNAEGKTYEIDRKTGETKEDYINELESDIEGTQFDGKNPYSIVDTNNSYTIVQNYIDELNGLYSVCDDPRYIQTIIGTVMAWIDTYDIDFIAYTLLKAREEDILATRPVVYNDNGEGERYLSKLHSFLSSIDAITDEQKKELDNMLDSINESADSKSGFFTNVPSKFSQNTLADEWI